MIYYKVGLAQGVHEAEGQGGIHPTMVLSTDNIANKGTEPPV